MERRLFVLGRSCRSEHLRGTGLVETGAYATSTDGVKKSGCPQSRDIARVFRIFKANHHMALGAQVVDLIRMDAIDEIGQTATGREIAVMQEQMGVGSVGVDINVVYATRIECTGAPNDSVHFITF